MRGSNTGRGRTTKRPKGVNMADNQQVIVNQLSPPDSDTQMVYAPGAMPTTFVNQFAVGFTTGEVYMTLGEAPSSGPEANQSLAKVRLVMSHASLLNLAFQLTITVKTLQELYGGPIPVLTLRSQEEMQEVIKRVMTEMQQQAQSPQEGLGGQEKGQ